MVSSNTGHVVEFGSLQTAITLSSSCHVLSHLNRVYSECVMRTRGDPQFGIQLSSSFTIGFVLLFLLAWQEMGGWATDRKQVTRLEHSLISLTA